MPTVTTVDIVVAVPGDDLVVTVTENDDDGDYSANDISLREAINAANSLGGANTIEFDDPTRARPAETADGIEQGALPCAIGPHEIGNRRERHVALGRHVRYRHVRQAVAGDHRVRDRGGRHREADWGRRFRPAVEFFLEGAGAAEEAGRRVG